MNGVAILNLAVEDGLLEVGLLKESDDGDDGDKEDNRARTTGPPKSTAIHVTTFAASLTGFWCSGFSIVSFLVFQD